jgi:hemolysin III
VRPRVTARKYTLGEEIANSVIHGVGALLAIGGLAVLTAFAAMNGTAWHIVACSIFGATLVLLYAASTLHHSVTQPRAKQVLRYVDDAAIFLLIAGTYTPLTLVSLRGGWGWALFGVVWALAILGIVSRLLIRRRWAPVRIALYVVMGWMVAIAIKPMIASVAPGGLVLLFTGGGFYTGGLVFYVWRRLPYHHAVWHTFVLMGSALHFFAILLYVIPRPG